MTLRRAVLAAALVIILAWAFARADDETLRMGGHGPIRAMPSFVQVTKVADSVWVFSAGTANAVACLTDSGWIVVDTGTRPEAPMIRQEITRLAQRPFHCVVNTHFHDDHAGGNALYEGMGVPVWASEQGRRLIASRGARVERGAPSEIARLEAFRKSLPKGEASSRVDGFAAFFADWWREALDDVKREPNFVKTPTRAYRRAHVMRIGADTIELRALPASHTGGDGVVIFRTRKVAVVGDVVAAGSAPWADQFMGDGRMDGMFAAQDSLLRWIPADTTWRVVPGHGPPIRPADLRANRDSLAAFRVCVRQAWDVHRARESTGNDCAGVGFNADQGGYAAWLFYEDWTRKRLTHP